MSELELKNAYRAGATDFATWLTTQETAVMVGGSRPVYAMLLKEFISSHPDVFGLDDGIPASQPFVEPDGFFLYRALHLVHTSPKSSTGYEDYYKPMYAVEFNDWGGTRRVGGQGRTLTEAWSEAAKAIATAKQTTPDEINGAVLRAQIPDPQPTLGAFIIEPKGYHLSGAFHDLQFKRFEIKFTTIDEPRFTCYGEGDTFKAACNAAHASVIKHEAQAVTAISKQRSPLLGLATNAELIAELAARYSSDHSTPDYRRV